MLQGTDRDEWKLACRLIGPREARSAWKEQGDGDRQVDRCLQENESGRFGRWPAVARARVNEIRRSSGSF